MLTYTRLWASPGAAHALYRMAMETDIGEVLPAIRVPTLVLYREPFREQSLDVANRIHDAKAVELPGTDAGIATGDEPTAEIERFLRGTELKAEAERVLATILFTDIVGSTEQAAELGDRAWRDVIQRHHALVRGELARHRGEELDTAGDGFFAAFDGPGRAITCGCAIRDGVRALGLEVRTGVHTGECERVAGKLGGIAVSIGARITALAGPGEVLVSSTVKDLTAGSGIEFEDRGEHELKGVPAEWRLYAVR
jgi:class 3 adenylate cyclase